MATMNLEAEKTSAKKVADLIKAAGKAYTNAKEAVQKAGIAIIIHAKTYGDCSQAKNLARAVPARERNSLIGWFALYSPIGVQIGKVASDDKCRFIKPTSNRYNDFDIDGAKANMWYDDPAGTNPEPKALNTLFTFYDSMDAFIKRAIKDAEKAMEDESKAKYDPEQAPLLKAQAEDLLVMFNKYRSKHLADVSA